MTFKQAIIGMITVAVVACTGGYSFTGGDVGDAKTVSVERFPNNAPLVQPNLSQFLTEAIKDIFVQQTNLRLVDDDGDFHFSGSITDYRITPLAPQADQTSSQSRLTIGIRVVFENHIEPKKSYEENFSRFADFDADANFSSIEEQLIRQINEELAENVLNRAIVNW
ncbi:MAG: LPS assembly lipoprotein LptE [Cryomorphaceae bacterium]|nr:LPS assembly lipoprotein LptE [Cryomorphaceae bacterium]